MFTVNRLGRYSHNSHTFSRSDPPSRTSEADCMIVSERKYLQNVLTAGNTATRRIPHIIVSFLMYAKCPMR